MKTLKGYKVVCLRKRRKWGWCGPEASGAVAYKAGRWTRPFKSYGPLAVFAQLKDAREFRAAYGACPPEEAIWCCDYRASKRKKLRNRWGTWALPLPPGTLLAEAVKLVRRVA